MKQEWATGFTLGHFLEKVYGIYTRTPHERLQESKDPLLREPLWMEHSHLEPRNSIFGIKSLIFGARAHIWNQEVWNQTLNQEASYLEPMSPIFGIRSHIFGANEPHIWNQEASYLKPMSPIFGIRKPHI
jgi:hypothetical protein